MSAFLHHLTLHFPIVLTMTLAALGAWSRAQEGDPARVFVRWAGWVTLALTTTAAVSGIVSATDLEQLTHTQEHHRYLGIMAWCVVLCATLTYDQGVRAEEPDWRFVGTGLWGVAAAAIIGAGHWGGASVHAKIIPW